MMDTQGSMDTVVTGMRVVTRYQSGCFGWGCPLREYCARYRHDSIAEMLISPWMELDYMLIEQGYDPVYCEFYIYNGSQSDVNPMGDDHK